MNAIIAKNLHKSFGSVKAVDDVSLTIPVGSIHGFLGPNGAGKTTTIRMITGVLTPDTGSVQVLGIDVQADPIGAKMNYGLIPENGTVYADLTAEQNILLTAKFYNLDKPTRKKRTTEILDRLSLTERKDDLVRTFSKGMRQRVSIACAIIHSPPILILDEPTTGLDVFSRRMVIETVRFMNKNGSTILLTTHNIEEANELCSMISVIKKGKIVASGSPEKLKIAFDTSRYIEIAFNQSISSHVLKTDQITRVEPWGDKWRIYTNNMDMAVKSLVDVAGRENLAIVSIHTSGPTLEEAFIRLTGGV